MGLPSDPIGRALVQLIARDRYERWLQQEVQSLLEAGLRDMGAKLARDFATLSPAALSRRALMYRQVSTMLGTSYGKGAAFLQAEMKAFAGLESTAQIQHLKMLVADGPGAEATLQSLTRAEVKAIAEFPIAGLGIGDWFEKQASDMNVAIKGQIQLGLLNGETIPQIVSKRLLPQQESAETPGLLPRTRRSTLALVRTTTTTIQTEASYRTLESIGDDLVPSYRYVAVRDGRTTPICRALDGKIFRFSDPKNKRPPQHVNCRSTIVAAPDYAALGIPKPNSIAGGFTMGSYAEWLSAQSAEFQSDLLGKAGAGLFRSGRATLADLIASDGRRMTRSALAATYGT
jgi:SPP1 gp7 family putative phage head morphogenesis protein